MQRRGTAALVALWVAGGFCLSAGGARADCGKLPDHEALTSALKASVKPAGGPANGGLDNHMWAVVVDRNGFVCAVTFSGAQPGDQWPGSRLIAAEKANTANALSLDGFALSTANLYAPVQPGGSLYGLEDLAPPNADAIFSGNPADYGKPNDPFVGQSIGGIVVFGGGLALYDVNGVVGGLGVSGDRSCADHNVAWRVREALGLDKVPAGVGPDGNDEIIYDIPATGLNPKSITGYGHPMCGGETEIAIQIGGGILVGQ